MEWRIQMLPILFYGAILSFCVLQSFLVLLQGSPELSLTYFHGFIAGCFFFLIVFVGEMSTEASHPSIILQTTPSLNSFWFPYPMWLILANINSSYPSCICPPLLPFGNRNSEFSLDIIDPSLPCSSYSSVNNSGQWYVRQSGKYELQGTFFTHTKKKKTKSMPLPFSFITIFYMYMRKPPEEMIKKKQKTFPLRT